MPAYRFAISCIGVGGDADEAFAFVLDNIQNRPSATIERAVEYAEIEDDEDLQDQLGRLLRLHHSEE